MRKRMRSRFLPLVTLAGVLFVYGVLAQENVPQRDSGATVTLVGRGSGPVEVIDHEVGQTSRVRFEDRLNVLDASAVARDDAFRQQLDALNAERMESRRQAAQEAEETAVAEAESAAAAAAEKKSLEEARVQYRDTGLERLRGKGFQYWLQDGQDTPDVVYDSWNGRFVRTEEAIEQEMGDFENWRQEDTTPSP